MNNRPAIALAALCTSLVVAASALFWLSIWSPSQNAQYSASGFLLLSLAVPPGFLAILLTIE